MLKHGIFILVAALALAGASFGCSLVPDGGHPSPDALMQTTVH